MSPYDEKNLCSWSFPEHGTRIYTNVNVELVYIIYLFIYEPFFHQIFSDLTNYQQGADVSQMESDVVSYNFLASKRIAIYNMDILYIFYTT